MAFVEPTRKDIPYGPHPRNVLDLYLASGDGRRPVFVNIHGGGFLGGDKRNISQALVDRMRDAGIHVASIHYRLSQQAPWPACVHDAARAVQFLRLSGGIDPDRLAVGGGSAGGGISLWLCFHDDLAEADSDDVVRRQSSRPACACCLNTQSSYDPNFIRSIIPGPAGDHLAMQMLFRAPLERQGEARFQAIFADGSALTHLKADARPVLMFYRIPDVPLDEPLSQEVGIHHPVFGKILKERMDALGAECLLRRREDYPGQDDRQLEDTYAREAVAFCKRHFGMTGSSK